MFYSIELSLIGHIKQDPIKPNMKWYEIKVLSFERLLHHIDGAMNIAFFLNTHILGLSDIACVSMATGEYRSAHSRIHLTVACHNCVDVIQGRYEYTIVYIIDPVSQKI